jgi:hypothetical protein
MAPLVVRYKYVTIKAERFDRVGPEEMERRMNSYRESTAPRLVDLILRMGGIYVKIGQGERKKRMARDWRSYDSSESGRVFFFLHL